MPPSQNNLPLGEPVDTTPAPWPQPVTLNGRFGRIEKLVAEKHGPALWHAVAGHDDLWTYMKTGPFSDEAAFMELQKERATSSDPFTYVILDHEGAPLGLSCLMNIRPDLRVIEVGNIFYAPALQRTPLGTEAQYLLMRYVFEDLGYRRYEWKTSTLNAASRRAGQRYGFTFEGIFRQNDIVKGRNRDTAWYSIIDKEWPTRKAAFEIWLAPDNFDSEGRQKKTLAHIEA
ncbi:MAG: GNAT family protein [Pseudomonadota bacterium]